MAGCDRVVLGFVVPAVPGDCFGRSSLARDLDGSARILGRSLAGGTLQGIRGVPNCSWLSLRREVPDCSSDSGDGFFLFHLR